MSDFINNFFGQSIMGKPTKAAKTRKAAKSTKTAGTKAAKTTGTTKSTGSKGTMVKGDYVFVGIKKSKTEGKKYDAIFNRTRDGREKIVSFGKSGEKDYTQHKDRDLRDFYDFKYKKKQDWKNLMHPNALNKWILWDKPTLESGVSSYKKMFKDKYNK